MPMVDTPSRKLAVIMHADVVGSTSLVRQNETLAHQRIKDTFLRFSKTIESYRGTAHELRGDALVAEFARASDAVCASVAFQNENTVFNASLEDDLQPRLRVGIAMGEVVIADNTITGDGVVLAQRLEQIAEPGRVCIQSAVYETVPKRLPFSYEPLGEQTLKGFGHQTCSLLQSLLLHGSGPAAGRTLFVAVGRGCGDQQKSREGEHPNQEGGRQCHWSEDGSASSACA